MVVERVHAVPALGSLAVLLANLILELQYLRLEARRGG